MGDRTPPRRRQNRLPTLRRERRRRMRTPSPDSRGNESSGEALQAPPNRNRRGPRNILNELNEAAEDNNNNNNNTHQNENDHTVRDEDRPDHDNNQARGGGEDVNHRKAEPVQPELKF